MLSRLNKEAVSNPSCISETGTIPWLAHRRMFSICSIELALIKEVKFQDISE
jgi:hypothetical protein